MGTSVLLCELVLARPIARMTSSRRAITSIRRLGYRRGRALIRRDWTRRLSRLDRIQRSEGHRIATGFAWRRPAFSAYLRRAKLWDTTPEHSWRSQTMSWRPNPDQLSPGHQAARRPFLGVAGLCTVFEASSTARSPAFTASESGNASARSGARIASSAPSSATSAQDSLTAKTYAGQALEGSTPSLQHGHLRPRPSRVSSRSSSCLLATTPRLSSTTPSRARGDSIGSRGRVDDAARQEANVAMTARRRMPGLRGVLC